MSGPTGELRRGELLRRTPVDSTTDEVEAVLISDQDVAQWAAKRRVCTQIASEYAQSEVHSVKSPDWYSVAGGVALIAGGFALANADPNEEALTYLGAALIIGGGAWGLFGLLDGETEYKDVPTRPARELTTECRDDRVARQGRARWSLRMGSAERSGETDESGRVELRPLVLELLREASRNESELRSLIAQSGVTYAVSLGKAVPVGHSLPIRSIPESFFQTLAREYESRLSGDALSRWENCRIISKSSREAFECHWAQ